MSLTVSYGCLLSLIVCFSAMKNLHVSHCLLCLLATSHCPSQCIGVAAYLSLSPMVSGCLSLSIWFQGDATCLSQSLLVLWSCCMSLTVYYGYWLSLPVLAACLSRSPMVAGYLSLSLWSYEDATCPSLPLIVSSCHSLSLLDPWSCCMCLTVFYNCLSSLTVSLVPWSFCMSLTVLIGGWLSLTVSTSAMELLNVSRCLLLLMAASPILWSFYMSLSVFCC